MASIMCVFVRTDRPKWPSITGSWPRPGVHQVKMYDANDSVQLAEWWALIVAGFTTAEASVTLP